MKTIKYKILNFLFVITLGKFFLQWILPTNPQSRNPLWRILTKSIKLNYSATPKNIKTRFFMAKILFIVHLSLAIISFILDDIKIAPSNVLVNFYPMWVQVYIGLRCYWAIKKRTGKYSTTVINQNLILKEAV